MHKRRRKLANAVILLLAISMVTYLQWGRDIDVFNNMTASSASFHENHIIITLNRLVVINKEKYAEEIIRKCRENDFQSVMFSYDAAKPNALYITVYRSRLAMIWQKPIFTFRYTQKANLPNSNNIVENPEAFALEID